MLSLHLCFKLFQFLDSAAAVNSIFSKNMERGRGSKGPFGGIMSSIFGFGGRDPFDDPFFTRPFPNLSQSSMLQHPTTSQQVDESKSPVIQEIDMEDEEEAQLEQEKEDGDTNASKKKRDKAYANRNPLVEHPEDQIHDNSKSKIITKDVTRGVKDMKLEGTQSKPRSMSYRRVTYGGIDGTYYTATTTQRAGSDGRVLEESKQADSTTGEATHRISRGIQDKGHSLTRKLASDGKVDTMQTLHNLEEDELAGFEQTWNSNASKEIPGWKSGFDFPANAGTSSNWLTNWEPGFRDPFSGVRPTNNSAQPGAQNGRQKKVVRINIE